ncbi:hypothetical protein R3W88_028937 [Solanum pinnatisectum]|uniref:Uncharacterized protein n=1 Tax=Solanum pinnatisectum TaxID=50273 RepID=A0AAV9K776_9SOLN|nr:hypothetical protein R3W88_028937 [Solanum pinnatisectum]
MKVTTTFFLLSFLILISQYLVISTPYPPCASGGGCDGPNCEWPELVGVEVKRAKSIIEQANPYVTGVILPDSGCIHYMDVCMNRVWICPDKHGRVATVPKVG